MTAVLIIWTFWLHVCGVEATVGPFDSKQACEAKRAELVLTILGPMAFGECERSQR